MMGAKVLLTCSQLEALWQLLLVISVTKGLETLHFLLTYCQQDKKPDHTWKALEKQAILFSHSDFSNSTFQT